MSQVLGSKMSEPESESVPVAFVAAMGHAARQFRDGLSSDQQRVACWRFAAVERGDWHYAPRQRHGLALRAMDERQQAAAYGLLASALSPIGNQQARAIMALETVLDELEQGQRQRDPLNYAFTLFGDPDETPWGWRVEGHHLIINATIASPAAAAITPTFWGSNPARIPHGQRAGERIMAHEHLLGLELAQSLSDDQRAQALLQASSIGNVITERGRAQALQTPGGLGFTHLDEAQRTMVMALVDAYVGKASDVIGRPYLERLRADGHDLLHLAWAGGMAEGQAFYYRIHAPRLLIEFDCTQNDANHIHALWRDPTNDWGRDVLGEHYHDHHDHD